MGNRPCMCKAFFMRRKQQVKQITGPLMYISIYFFHIYVKMKWKRGDGMKVHIDLDPSHEELEIIIRTKEVTEEVQYILKILEGRPIKQIVGIADQQFYLLEFKEIYWFYSEGRKVFAQTTKGNIEVKYRLYELETSLQREGFVRFSKSILANIKHVKSFEMSFSGSMCAHFSNGMKEYVSRKYVPLIKEALNIGG